MTTGLRYRFKEETHRGTPLEITGPKALIDAATSSTRGPLFYDATAGQGERVAGRSYDGQGNVTLDFDLGTNGISHYQGPARIRSFKTLEIIAQLDAFAHRQDLPDPRITIALSPIGVRSGDMFQSPRSEDEFSVSFEQSQGDMTELVAKIRKGMVHASDILHLYNSTDHSVSVTATTTDEGGLDLRMGAYRHTRQLIMATNPAMPPQGGRVELIGDKGRSAEERLVALVGIISALPDIRE